MKRSRWLYEVSAKAAVDNKCFIPTNISCLEEELPFQKFTMPEKRHKIFRFLLRQIDIPGSVRQKAGRSEEHTSELQSRETLVCRRMLAKKKSQHHQQP